MASTLPARHGRQKAQSSERLPHIIERTTIEGRRLRYELKVIQQPERARACGSGAKSSADRRPVDPPPVVELKIFETGPDHSTDITFAYDANFFLFATLETARPIAHGRMAAPPAAQVPVLTGMPVSGMAYLDRPAEAGYLIFPDLSVRHEGKYRLSFNLYEETKNPEKDADKGSAALDGQQGPGTHEPEACFDWRMELKSDVFDVFSAKKFPGLAESTHLSRTVAEQGCRVRIRRDVRMRRRNEGKASEDFVEEHEYERKSRTPSVEEFHRERSRSSSAVSEGEFRQPMDPHGSLGFGPPQYQQQPQFAAPPPPPPSSSQGPSPAVQSFHHHQPQQYGAPVPLPPQPHPYGYDRQPPHSAYPSTVPREMMQRDEEAYRRASMAGHNNEQFPRHYSTPEHNFPRNPQTVPTYAHTPSLPNTGLPPLQLHHLSGKYEGSPPAPLPPVRSIAPTLHSPTYERTADRSNSFVQHALPLTIAPAPTPELVETQCGGKRSFASTFGSSTSKESLYNGMRPSSPHDNVDDDDDEDFQIEMQMTYKRASGDRYTRKLPALNKV